LTKEKLRLSLSMFWKDSEAMKCEVCGRMEDDLLYDDWGNLLCSDCIFEQECENQWEEEE
jgi:NMD protein affecting ribosome stability and mRNA decay